MRYDTLSVAKQNVGGDMFADSLRGLSPAQLDEYVTSGTFLLEGARFINRSRSRELLNAYDSILQSHGATGFGALGVMLSAGLARARGADVEVIAFDGDAKLTIDGSTKEFKTSFRVRRAGDRRHKQLQAGFTLAQLQAAAPAHVGILGFDLVGTQVRANLLHAQTADISWLYGQSVQRGTFKLRLPFDQDGRYSTSSLAGKTLQGARCLDVNDYGHKVANTW